MLSAKKIHFILIAPAIAISIILSACLNKDKSSNQKKVSKKITTELKNTK